MKKTLSSFVFLHKSHTEDYKARFLESGSSKLYKLDKLYIILTPSSESQIESFIFFYIWLYPLHYDTSRFICILHILNEYNNKII